jgi:hypothetical protein
MRAFGRPVEYRPEGGSDTFVLRAVFDESWTEVDPRTGRDADGVAVSTTAPALHVRLADLPAKPGQGDGVTIDGRDYEVVDVRPDGAGGATLVLQRA